MRNILLASAAMLVTTGVALAVAPPTSQTVTVSASLAETCTITDPNDVSVVGTTIGSESNDSSFSFTCNFAGAGAAPALKIAFASTYGGLKSGDEVVDYTIKYGLTNITSANAFAAPVPVNELSLGANQATTRSFKVALTEDITVAGDYSDVVTVSVSF